MRLLFGGCGTPQAPPPGENARLFLKLALRLSREHVLANRPVCQSTKKEMATMGDFSHRPGREEMYSPVARLQQHVVQGLAQACTKRMQKTPALFFALNFALRFVPSLSWQIVSVS
jgi:hypothetical protein